MHVSACRTPLWVLLVALFALQPCSAAPGRSQVPGTDISMAAPEGFRASTRFHGFEHTDYLATVMVVDIPGPVSEIQKGMTREGLASRGMTLISSETRAWNGEDAVLLQVSQKAQGIDFLKWILVSGSERSTTMIVGSYPVEKKDLSAPIQKAMLDATRG